ncbi:MAG: TonB-dependent receptor [Kiritimatiellales bacterium]
MKIGMFAAAGLISLSVFAEEVSTTSTTAEATRIVVTATRRADDIRTISGNPTVISSADIAAGHYSSMTEILSKKAGLFFKNFTDDPSQASVDIRGFGGDNPHGRVLVLLNGRKLNRPDMASINWAQIPLQAVEKIEVVRGPNSVLYGDHAVGGVINIITKEATKTPETTLGLSVGSYEAHDLNAVTSGDLDGIGYVATAGHQSGDGYRDRSRYDINSASLRLSGTFNEIFSAYAELSAIKDQYQMPGALSENDDRRSANRQDDAARSEYYNLFAGVTALLSEEVVFNLDGGWTHKDIDSDLWGTHYDYRILNYTLSPKFTLLSPLGTKENRLVIGMDFSFEKLNTQTDLPNSDTKATKQIAGGYIADTFFLTDKLLLNAGARLEQNKIDVKFKGGSQYDDDIRHTEHALETGLDWLPNDKVKVFGKISRTYRYPFLDEQAIYSGWGGDAFNPDLDPETGINYEAGVEVLPVENLVLQATVFRTDMKDEIGWGGTQNVNMDKTTHRGIELYAGYSHDLFAIDAFYTGLYSKFTNGDNSGNKVPWVPQNKLDVNLSFFLTDALTLSTHMGYVGKMYALGDNANSGADKQSDYALFDLLLDYKFKVRNVECSVFAGVDNIFETEYNYLVSYGGYYPAPERTYKAGLTMKF